MRIPFLILCLAVVYGACRTYRQEENIDLTEEIENNGDYKLDYANVPLETFLSRHKRASLISPIMAPLKSVLSLLGSTSGSIISTTTNLIKFISGATLGQIKCSKVEFSLELILKVVTNPIQGVEDIICYIIQTIGSSGRAVMNKMFDLSIAFFKNIFLPGLHTTLNTLDKTGLLPPQISAMIKVFNLVYGFLQMIGYVPK